MKAIIILLLFFSISYSLVYAEEPSQGWERLADMPEPRSEMESAVIDEKIYVIGGLSNTNRITNSVFVFDTNNETWSIGTSMPLGLHHAGVASYDDKLYVVGGYVLGGYYQGWMPSDILLIYDSITYSWSHGAEMPTPRGALTVQFVDGKLYAIGGFNEFTRTENEVYDPVTDSWEAKSQMPTPREHLASSVLDDQLYVIGGRNGQSNSNANEMYDYTTDTWKTLEPLPTARSGLTASTLSGGIFVFGGESSLHTFEENEAYIPEEGWSTQQPMPISRHGLSSSTVGENIYLIGGGVSPGFSFSAITEKYQNTIVQSKIAFRNMNYDLVPNVEVEIMDLKIIPIHDKPKDPFDDSDVLVITFEITNKGVDYFVLSDKMFKILVLDPSFPAGKGKPESSYIVDNYDTLYDVELETRYDDYPNLEVFEDCDYLHDRIFVNQTKAYSICFDVLRKWNNEVLNIDGSKHYFLVLMDHARSNSCPNCVENLLSSEMMSSDYKKILDENYIANFPSWIQKTIEWYNQELISETELIFLLEFLIENELYEFN